MLSAWCHPSNIFICKLNVMPPKSYWFILSVWCHPSNIHLFICKLSVWCHPSHIQYWFISSVSFHPSHIFIYIEYVMPPKSYIYLYWVCDATQVILLIYIECVMPPKSYNYSFWVCDARKWYNNSSYWMRFATQVIYNHSRWWDIIDGTPNKTDHVLWMTENYGQLHLYSFLLSWNG